jgi:hypothetical protein
VNKTKVDYVFLIPGNNFSKEFLLSWTETVTYLMSNNFSFFYFVKYMPIVSSIRNYLLGTAITDQSQTFLSPPGSTKVFSDILECKKVIFIDSDMVWSLESMKKLLNSEHDFISAPYLLGDGKTVSVKKSGEDHFMNSKDLKLQKNVFEIDSSGLGFFSCSFDSLKNIEYPWFSTEEISKNINGGIHQGHIGEDVYFCNKVKSYGNKIFTDPSIIVGHQKNKTSYIE